MTENIDAQKLIEWLASETDGQHCTYIMYKENKGDVFKNQREAMLQVSATIGVYNDISLYIFKQCNSVIKVSELMAWLKSQIDNLNQVYKQYTKGEYNDFSDSFYELAMIQIRSAMSVYDRVIHYIERKYMK